MERMVVELKVRLDLKSQILRGHQEGLKSYQTSKNTKSHTKTSKTSRVPTALHVRMRFSPSLQ